MPRIFKKRRNLEQREIDGSERKLRRTKFIKGSIVHASRQVNQILRLHIVLNQHRLINKVIKLMAINQVSQLRAINQLNQVSKLREINQLNKINTLKQINNSNQVKGN